MEQLTVDLGDAAYDEPLPPSSPLWETAINTLLNHAKLAEATEFDKLPIPLNVEAAWRVQRGHIPLRCLTAYVLYPLDGGPPGFRSRVDVLIIR